MSDKVQEFKVHRYDGSVEVYHGVNEHETTYLWASCEGGVVLDSDPAEVRVFYPDGSWIEPDYIEY